MALQNVKKPFGLIAGVLWELHQRGLVLGHSNRGLLSRGTKIWRLTCTAHPGAGSDAIKRFNGWTNTAALLWHCY